MSTFDPAVYAALVQANPDAAQAYLTSTTSQPSSPAPAATFRPPQHTAPYNAPQAQPGPQGTPAPQAPQAQRGSLSQGFDQGARAGGHGNAAKWPAPGSTFTGILARDMNDTDCRQATDPGTKQPKFFRKSGAPQFEFTIPVNVQPSADYPDGKATIFTSKYRLHQAVVRAMIEQGYQPGEGLHEGDVITVTRINDVSSGMGQPGHDFTASIQRGAGTTVAQAAAPFQTGPTVTTTPANGESFTTSTAPAAAPTTGDVPSIPGLTPEQAALVAQYGIKQ